ncbi:MAG: hydrogenase small subunit [Lentisphaerota bacterium]
MKHLTRRDFLKIGGILAAGAGLAPRYAEAFTAGLEKLSKGLPRVIWLQGQSCSGCSVSLLNADNPYILEVVTDMISMVFHQTISAATGEVAMKVIDDMEAGQEPFILVVEGAIPLLMPEACVIGGRRFEDILKPLIRKAQFVVGVGTCATYGGIPAAEGNPTGAASVKEFMDKNSFPTDRKLVNVPSCPAHPDSIVGTLAFLAGRGYPPVNASLLTPDMFFAHSTHDDCPRYHYYNKHLFAKKFGDSEGCLFQLGCLGMLSYTDCPRRQWNGGVNWCIRAAAPCIGCSHPQFGKNKAFPFYRLGEKNHAVEYNDSDRKGGEA